MCTCVPEGCSLFGVETVVFRLHFKGELKTCTVEGITVLRCSDVFHATRVHEFALSHFKGKKRLYFLNSYTHGLGGECWEGGEAHIFVVKSLEEREMWRREMVGQDI